MAQMLILNVYPSLTHGYGEPVSLAPVAECLSICESTMLSDETLHPAWGSLTNAKQADHLCWCSAATQQLRRSNRPQPECQNKVAGLLAWALKAAARGRHCNLALILCWTASTAGGTHRCCRVGGRDAEPAQFYCLSAAKNAGSAQFILRMRLLMNSSRLPYWPPSM